MSNSRNAEILFIKDIEFAYFNFTVYFVMNSDILIVKRCLPFLHVFLFSTGKWCYFVNN